METHKARITKDIIDITFGEKNAFESENERTKKRSADSKEKLQNIISFMKKKQMQNVLGDKLKELNQFRDFMVQK